MKCEGVEERAKELLSFLRTGFLISKICLPANFELNSGFIVEKKRFAFQTLWSILHAVQVAYRPVGGRARKNAQINNTI